MHEEFFLVNEYISLQVLLALGGSNKDETMVITGFYSGSD